MADTNFNYTDQIQSTAYTQFIADQHDQAVQTTGRRTYVFLLDKIDTERSEVYKEEKHGRIYLPHFEERAIYTTNPWIATLNAQNYTEVENTMEFEFDFGRMVHIISELKQKTAGILSIKNISKIPLWIEINDFITLKAHSETLFKKEISGTIYKFMNEVNKETDLIELSYTGDSEYLEFLEKHNSRILPRRTINLSLNNSIYKNTSDVIDQGTLILNDRMKLYQVIAAYPKNDNYGRYISWNVKCDLINMAKADGLPADYAEVIKKNQYGLTKKFNLG